MQPLRPEPHGVVAEPGIIRFERTLPGPIERVWAYLTESDKRARWLAAGPLDARAGGAVALHFRNAELSANDEPAPAKYSAYENCGDTYGRVTRCEPPRLLAYTWSDSDEPEDDDSEVTFELSPRGDAVLLVLTHRRLRAQEMLSVAGGWHTHLGILADHLEGRAPRPFWKTHTRLEQEYAARMGS